MPRQNGDVEQEQGQRILCVLLEESVCLSKILILEGSSSLLVSQIKY